MALADRLARFRRFSTFAKGASQIGSASGAPDHAEPSKPAAASDRLKNPQR